MTFCAAAIAFETFFILKKYARDAIVGIGTVSLLYILPIFKGRRLRDFSYLKIILISLTWASVVVWIPTAAVGRGFSVIEVLLFLEKMAFIFAITLPFDIRDSTSDAAAGVKTIPLSIGVEKTKKIGFYAITLSLSIIFILTYFGVYSVFHYFAIAVTLILSYFLIEKTDETKPIYFYYFLSRWHDDTPNVPCFDSATIGHLPPNTPILEILRNFFKEKVHIKPEKNRQNRCIWRLLKNSFCSN
ncbi:MAG: UbiA family prenyltransferase [Saprospiraceae bacterium]|nr:UbiA family prenyltransferase [Saprospiraceae bacterium]